MAIKTVNVTLDGKVTTLTLNSSTGLYEATLTAPDKSSYNQTGGYYNMSITATDDAGNSTSINGGTNESLRLVVKETTAPVATIKSPTNGSYITNSQPTINWTITDNDSGINASTIYIEINGTKVTSGITKTAITNGYNCSYSTTLPEGSNTIKVGVRDNDGNAASVKTSTFTVDTIPPTLNITSPTDNLLTNKATLIVSGVTNDATSTPITLTINGETVNVASDGSFSKSITLSEGSNTIKIIATDKAGKQSQVTKTVKLDTHAPTISTITITPNPVNSGKTFTISVSVSD